MSDSNIYDLPQYIIIDILCFLPATSIIRCSCVCKEWTNIIYQPYFPQFYISRAKAPTQVVLEIDYNIVLAQLDESLYTTSFPHDILVPNRLIFNLNIRQVCGIPPPIDMIFITCPVTKWIFPFWDTRQYYQPFHMYNPITGQHIVVKLPDPADRCWRTGALIFAEKSNELKLLVFRMKFIGLVARRYFADILTIGSNTWRKIDKVPSQEYSTPIPLNGYCHWIDDNSQVIDCFDMEKEVFKVMQTPEPKTWNFSYLGTLHGCICMSFVNRKSLVNEIWVMNKYGIQESWTKTFVFNVKSALEPLTCLKNGEILMRGSNLIISRNENYSGVVAYKPGSKQCRYVEYEEGLHLQPNTWLNVFMRSLKKK